MSGGGLSRRLERLEEGSGSCPACGLGPGSRIVYRIAGDLVDDPAPDEPEVSSPPCPRCGQRRRIVIDFDDAASRAEMDRLSAERERFLASRPDLLSDSASRRLVPDYPPKWSDEGGG
jgi:hypothetical protein